MIYCRRTGEDAEGGAALFDKDVPLVRNKMVWRLFLLCEQLKQFFKIISVFLASLKVLIENQNTVARNLVITLM